MTEVLNATMTTKMWLGSVPKEEARGIERLTNLYKNTRLLVLTDTQRIPGNIGFIFSILA